MRGASEIARLAHLRDLDPGAALGEAQVQALPRRQMGGIAHDAAVGVPGDSIPARQRVAGIERAQLRAGRGQLEIGSASGRERG